MGLIKKIFFTVVAACIIAFFAVITIGIDYPNVFAKALQSTKPLYKFEHPIITKSDSLYALGQFDNAILVLSDGLKKAELESEYELQVNLLSKLSFVNRRIGNWPQAEELLSQGVEVATSNLDKFHPALSTIYFYLGGLYDRTSRPILALENFNKALELRKQFYQDENADIANVLVGIGDVYRFNYSNYDSATIYYQKALEIQERVLEGGNVQLGANYYSIASVQRLKGEFDNALIYAQQALKTYEASEEVTPNLLANTYMLLGNIHFGREAYLESTQDYEKAVQISLENVIAQNNLGDYYNSLGAAYRMLDSTNIAKEYYFKAAERLSEQFGSNSLRLSYVYDNLGLIYKDQQAWDSSFYYYNKSLDIRNLNPGQNKSEIAQSYRFVGDVYKSKTEFSEALLNYQQSINILLGENLNALFKVSEEKLFEDQDLLKGLTAKATVLKNLASFSEIQDEKITFLKLALNEFDNADIIINKNRQSSDREGTKLFLSEYFRDSYENAIDCSFLLYELEGNIIFLEKANEFMAKSKGLLLLENLSGAEAINALGLPDSILSRENFLKAEIATITKNINSIKRSGVQSDTILIRLNQDLLNKTREQDIFKQELAQVFPNYFEFKYRYDYPALSDLQNWAKESKSTVVEYFYGSNYVFGLGVNKDSLKLFKILKDSTLESNLSKYNNSLKFGFNFSTQQIDYQDFKSSGYFLYQKLLNPIIRNSDSIQNLIIIPDGYLSTIPFDAFLFEELNSEKVDYKSLPYIHNEYLISYHFNSSMGINSSKEINRRTAKNLVAFSFSSEDVKDLSAEQILTTNQIGGSSKEINAISSLVENVDLFSGLNATEANFVENAPNYDIIHLAIHGEADLDNAMDSKLMFPAGGEGQDGSLYPFELYNLSLKAKLVVLSACESGIGKMFSGEGIFSMARAFAFAGSPSIVMSLWKVNDNATASLMESFYTALSNSENVDNALRIAKSNYLKDADELNAHPSNWAALVPIGNMNGFDWENTAGLTSQSYIIIAIGLLFLTIIFFLTRKRINFKTN
ncbi:CHAT domain-containing protein [Peijinzhouia sedimentorum]